MLDKYRIILPEAEGSAGEEWNQCLEQLKGSEKDGYRLVKLSIFIDAPVYSEYLRLRKEIGDSMEVAYGEFRPAFNITSHPPERPWKVAVEAGFMKSGTWVLLSCRRGTVNYVTGTNGNTKVLWAGGMGAERFPSDTNMAGEAAFGQLKDILESEGMTFNDIVRQWNYIGGITDCTIAGENYHMFNQVRSRQYGMYRTVEGFPAATGIGMVHGGVNLEVFAVKPDDSYEIRPVNNPDQVRPYEYGRKVLRGIQAPQFERALLLAGADETTLFVSGTASILGQDTVGLNDVARQTVVTIENILKLVEAGRSSLDSNRALCDTGNTVLLRVYIKKQSDFEVVRKICDSYFSDAPAVYIQADVCRTNLLVEIEAEFLSRS
jgi:enamine deaminase RidA (YjgF/YER057c/UK114 family)